MALVLITAFFGLVFLFLEFFLPGSIMAIIAVLLMGLSSVLFALKAVHFLSILGYVFFLMMLSALTIFLAMKRIKKSKNRSHLYLDNTLEDSKSSANNKHFIGQMAIAATDLRPSGYVILDNQLIQAISSGEFISKGAKLLITEGRGAYLVVKKQ